MAGDRTKNESYADYGADVFAVADGTVVSLFDGVEANAPGTLPARDPVLGPKLNDYASGNFFDERLQTGQPRRDELPLNLAIVDLSG